MKQPITCDVLANPLQIINLELLSYIAQGEETKIEKEKENEAEKVLFSGLNKRP